MTSSPENPTQQAPDHAQVAFRPPLLPLAAIVVGWLLKQVLPLSFLPLQVAKALGPVLFGASIAWFCWAVITMLAGRTSLPTNEPTNAIVTRGPYRFSRNPIYLAMVMVQVSAAVWANSLWFLPLAAVSVPIFAWGVISREEKYLERKFGEEYLAYKSRVRRWL